MEKSMRKVCILLISWISWVSSVWASPIVINDLINKSKEFDGKEVTIEAEVIGDMMQRGEYTWLNVTDGSAAMGIYIETVKVESIQITGSYKQKGDIVKITGTFHRAYDDQGGDMAIEAKNLEVIEQGKLIEEHIPDGKIKLLGGVVCLMGAILAAKKLKGKYAAK